MQIKMQESVQIIKSLTRGHFFSTPLRLSISVTIVSMLLAAVMSLILYPLDDLPSVLIMTIGIAGPVSYISSRVLVNLRVAVEEQKVKVALERSRADILSKFMRDTAHEFKTPLALIETSIYLLGRTPDNQKKQEYSQRASDQIKTINALLESILILTRLDSTDKSTYPRELIKSTELLSGIRAFNRGGRLKIVPENPDSLPTVKVNLSDLHLALKQIVDNALRFSPDNSEVTLKIATSDKQLIFEINDQGSGMSDETMQHIFDRFYRVDESHTTRGLGLGLSIAKRVIDLHGGHIEIQSAPGVGTSFRAYVPIV